MPVKSLLRRKQNKETETLLKTENMKTTVKHLTAGTIVALLLLVGNVNAKGTEAKASGHESIESTLQVEKWMIDELIWNTNSISLTEINQETETGLEVENWMINTETWNLSAGFVEETEAGMYLESWMTNEATWHVHYTENDTELTVENWMTGNKVWK